MTTLTVSGLTVAVGGRPVVDGLTLDLDTGALLVVTGPSGSGKSVALAAMAGVVRPTGGRVLLDERDVHRDRSARRKIGYCPPRTAVDGNVTVREHLGFHARCRGVDRDERHGVVDGVIELFDLAEHRDVLGGRLAPGVARRVHLARAFVHDPEVILLDDPLAGMDDASRRNVVEVLGSMTALDKIVVVASTRAEDFIDIASAVATIEAGRLESVRKPTTFAATT